LGRPATPPWHRFGTQHALATTRAWDWVAHSFEYLPAGGSAEPDAYEHMRTRATNLRVTVAEVSAMLIEAHDVMEKLGLGRK
jgi:hypothetical protein